MNKKEFIALFMAMNWDRMCSKEDLKKAAEKAWKVFTREGT
jgi:hypothetical protein